MLDKILELTRSIDYYLIEKPFTELSQIVKDTVTTWNTPNPAFGGIITNGTFIVMLTGACITLTISSKNGKLSKSISKFIDKYPTLSRVVILGGSIVAFILIAL